MLGKFNRKGERHGKIERQRKLSLYRSLEIWHSLMHICERTVRLVVCKSYSENNYYCNMPIVISVHV
jgi:hypothetical protein